jgi:uncharacterized protein with HEPN domain
MQPESAALLRDILDAADSIFAATTTKTKTDFLADRILIAAVHWHFCVIGEALSQLHRKDAAVAEQISEWKRIISLRNRLIHGYSLIQPQITWRIITSKLPVLRDELQTLLKE